MYAISTSAFVSILALALSLAVSVQAGNPRPECAKTIDVTEGKYTCNSLGTEFGLSVNDLKAMNSEMNSGSGLNCNDSLPTATLCVASSTPLCDKRVPAASTVCSDFLSANSLTAVDLYYYNDDVSEDCTKSGLVIGQEYCVKVKV